MENINSVTMTGNLTFDPELRSLASGTSVCRLRVACNGRRKNSSTGEWEDEPGYYDVTVWGKQGENCAKYLSKGRGVAIQGRLKWREWVDTDSGKKRQAVEIVAEKVQFLGDGGGEKKERGPVSDDEYWGGAPGGQSDLGTPRLDDFGGGAPAAQAAQPAATGGGLDTSDDIPF